MTYSGPLNDARFCIRARLDQILPDYPAMSLADADAIAIQLADALMAERLLRLT